MRLHTIGLRLLLCAVCITASHAAEDAARYPAPKEGDWIAKDFRFHTGVVMPELKIHYITIGEPTGEPVLILHGTAQSGSVMLAPQFAGELFGPASRSTRAAIT